MEDGRWLLLDESSSRSSSAAVGARTFLSAAICNERIAQETLLARIRTLLRTRMSALRQSRARLCLLSSFPLASSMSNSSLHGGHTARQRNLPESAGGEHLCGAALHFCSADRLQFALLVLRHCLCLQGGEEKIFHGSARGSKSPGRTIPPTSQRRRRDR